MTEQWKELKETIIEMRDNNGTGTQHEVCKFLANLMDVLENQMSGSEIPNSSDCISRQAVLDKKELIELEDGQSFYCISPEDVETLPSVNPQYTEVEGQKSEDAISRQAAIEIARSNIHYGLDKEYEYARELLQKTMAEINSLPPVNPQPKTGHWINGDCKGGNCSICGEYYAFYPESGDFNYCPNCGAKMIDLPDTNIGKMTEIPTGAERE